MDIQIFLSEQLKLNEYRLVDQLSLVKDKLGDVDELRKQMWSLYWSKVKARISELEEKYKVHFHRENNDYDKNTEEDKGYYRISYDVIFDGSPVTVKVSREGSYYCQINSNPQNEKALPEIILNDSILKEELNDPQNWSGCIWKRDEYSNSLQRFDRVLGRLFEMKGQINS